MNRKYQLDSVWSDGPIIELPIGNEFHMTGLSYSLIHDGQEYRSSHPMVIEPVCTGYVVAGQVRHDGGTCPIHEGA